jgi:histone-lysine N-methyltransferase SETMAR
MLTIFWSPLGFFLVEILPKGIYFDSQYFCPNVLFAIVQNRPSEIPGDRRRRMVVHFDNATSHSAKCTIDYLMANRLTRAPYPAFSPDLAPSDFSVFGKLKMTLIDAAFDNELLQV